MNPKKKVNISLEEILYYIMFSLLISLKGLGLDEGAILFRLGLLIAICLFGTKILVGKYSIKEMLFILLGGMWGIYIFFNIGSFSILIYALIVLGMKNISVSRVMKVGTIVYSICFFLTVTVAIFFNRTGVQLVHEKLGLGPILRESLGYTHPNVLHVTYIILMVFILYTCKKENILKTVVGLMLGNIWIFTYSISYTGMVISVVMILVYLYFVHRENISFLEQVLIKLILPICVCISTIVAHVVEGNLYVLLNTLFNYRIWAIKVFFNYHEITAFGQRILEQGFSLDNSYIYALAWYGVVFLVVMVIGYWILIDKYLKEDKRRELAIIIAFLFAGMTEQFLFNASIKNITLVFMGDIIFRSIREKEKELNLASKYNHTYDINFNKIFLIWEKNKNINWRKAIATYLVVNIWVLLILFLIPTNNYNRIYANERICDCGGELASKEEIIQAEDTLILGKISAEDQYYYFTKENSNLITVMDYRYKLSLSIYISAFITAIGISIEKKTKKRKRL